MKQKPGSYIAITREWKDGDRIAATYPMQIELEATPDNPNKVALLYGPLVLAGERERKECRHLLPSLILLFTTIIILIIFMFLPICVHH